MHGSGRNLFVAYLLGACAVVAVAMHYGIAVAAEAQGEPIIIGAIEDRSGAATFYSQQSVAGMKAFVDMVNAGQFLYATKRVGTKPGFLGRPIKALYEDDQSNPNITLVKVRKLIDSGAKIIFFMSSSVGALQARTVCAEQKVLCIAPTNSMSRIAQSPGNEYVFMVAATNEMIAEAYINEWKARGYKRIAYFGDDSATSKSVVSGYQKVFTGAGIETVATETVTNDARDVVAAIERARNAKPDVLLNLIIPAGTSVNFYTATAHAGITVPRWAGIADTAEPEIWRLAGSAINGVMAGDLMSTSNPNANELRAAYGKTRADAPMTYMQASVWDSLMLAKAAVEAAGSLDGERLKSEMEKIKDFPAALGQAGYTLNFGPDKHNGAGPGFMTIAKFENQLPVAVPKAP